MNAPVFPSAFAHAALEGLSRAPKTMSPKWLYDEKGAALFERITELPEYYPTRIERALLSARASEMVQGLGRQAVVIEFGAGSSAKTPLILAALEAPALYAPIDIAPSYLAQSQAGIQARFPELAVRPILGDFTRLSSLPSDVAAQRGARLGFFPGSTIANLDDAQMLAFLRHARALLGPGATMIVGVDTPKSLEVLLPAYDDSQGVTAAFNLNLLRRMNTELEADFELDAFGHEARWREDLSRVEMHLVSKRRQAVRVCGEEIEFGAGETIHTESSHKIAPDVFAARARTAGWASTGLWLAPRALFSIHRLAALAG